MRRATDRYATLGVVALLGCTETATVAPPRACDRSILADVPGAVLATAPRANCLDPPWTTWRGDLATPTAVRLGEQSANAFVLHVGDGPAVGESGEYDAMQSLFRGLPGALPLYEPGFQCPATDAGTDARLAIAICSRAIADVATDLAAAWSSSPVLRDHSASVCVVFDGLAGPRCAPSDPSCGPEVVDLPSPRAPPEEPSRCPAPLAIRGHDYGSCTYDGECVAGGCGMCTHWSFAPTVGLCPGLGPAYWCSCVAGRCADFH